MDRKKETDMTGKMAIWSQFFYSYFDQKKKLGSLMQIEGLSKSYRKQYKEATIWLGSFSFHSFVEPH